MASSGKRGNPRPQVEHVICQLHRGTSAKRARLVLFDFDGTFSLVRSGWVEMMAPTMVEILAEPNTGESEAELYALVEEFVV